MDEKKRKSSRSFDLEKGGKHSFDLNKTSARKFDLSKDSDEVLLEELKKELLADGKIDKEEVEQLRKVIYADGKIDQEEADFLFELNDAVSGKKNDPSWNQFFVQTISDYLLNDEKSPGVIDDEEGKWLVEKIGADGQVDGLEKELLGHLKKYAKKMPAAVTALMSGAIIAGATNSEKTDLQQLKKDILADGKIDEEEVEQLCKAIYADGKIDQEEADFLFELNDAVSGKKNDPSWNQFFVQTISDYLLNDEKSPGVIDDEEGKWLVEKIGADGQVDGLEKELLGHLKKKAKKMPSSVTTLLNVRSNPTDAGTTTSSDEDNSGVTIKKWIAIITALLVAGGVGYYYFNNSEIKEEKSPQIVQSESIDSSENESDSLKKENVMANENAPAADKTIDSGAKPTVVAGEKSSTPNVQNTIDADNVGNKENSSKHSDSKASEGNPTNSAISASGTSSKTSVMGTIEQKAHDVWKGVYGNNPERRKNLGGDYEAVQKRVNEMRRQGLY